MPITLTCTCGHKQSVASTMAGRTIACAGCGKAITAPAMGVLATPKAKAAPTFEPQRSTVGLLLLAAGVILLMLTGGTWLAWSLTRERPLQPMPIAQAPPQPEPTRPVEPPPRKPAEPKKEHPALIEPTRPAPQETPKPPPEPAKPMVIPPVNVEPVPQVGELPNPFLLPRLPEPPVVVKKPDPPKNPPNLIEPLKLVWKLKVNDVFYQELMVAQKPNFKVAGIPIVTGLQYRIVSKFTVTKANADGSLVVEQKIESAKLLFADDLTKAAAAGAIAKMPGTTYKIELSPKMDVTKLEGVKANPNIAAFDVAGAMGMQMTSLLDRDGWKELAQATFFQMDQPLKVGDRWSKPMTHNWGSLGSWSGQIHYLYQGKQANLHRTAFGLQLAYKQPAAGMVGLMKVNGANFQIQQAEGVLLFDSDKGRVVGAEERFRVRGVINSTLLGQNTLIEIEEDQHFQIRIHEKQVP